MVNDSGRTEPPAGGFSFVLVLAYLLGAIVVYTLF